MRPCSLALSLVAAAVSALARQCNHEPLDRFSIYAVAAPSTGITGRPAMISTASTFGPIYFAPVLAPPFAMAPFNIDTSGRLMASGLYVAYAPNTNSLLVGTLGLISTGNLAFVICDSPAHAGVPLSCHPATLPSGALYALATRTYNVNCYFFDPASPASTVTPLQFIPQAL